MLLIEVNVYFIDTLLKPLFRGFSTFGDKVFFENAQTVTTNYTIGDTFGAACNAMAAGPISINSGVTVTINSGEVLTIV